MPKKKRKNRNVENQKTVLKSKYVYSKHMSIKKNKIIILKKVFLSDFDDSNMLFEA